MSILADSELYAQTHSCVLCRLCSCLMLIKTHLHRKRTHYHVHIWYIIYVMKSWIIWSLNNQPLYHIVCFPNFEWIVTTTFQCLWIFISISPNLLFLHLRIAWYWFHCKPNRIYLNSWPNDFFRTAVDSLLFFPTLQVGFRCVLNYMFWFIFTYELSTSPYFQCRTNLCAIDG